MIDLRSDTVTKPTNEMREAMARAVVGDDVYEDDPTVIELETMSASITGKEAALFTPSGTMANQLAIMAQTRRGDEIIVGKNSHIVVHEVGAAAVLSGVGHNTIQSCNDILSGDSIRAAVRADDIHNPSTGLLCLENALANGTVVSIDMMKDAYMAAKEYDLPVHLGGARLFNAAEYLKVEAKEITQYSDTVMFCLSKGLASPVGSMLCGSHKTIKAARKYRKLLGGGMRQVGILAASGIISLEKMTKRLKTDHENAMLLAELLSKNPLIDIDINNVHINIVFFKINAKDFDHMAFTNYLLEHGIKTNPGEQGLYRFVTHVDISREDIFTVVDTVNLLLNREK